MAEGMQQATANNRQEAQAPASGPRRLDIVNRLRDRSYMSKAKDPLCEEAADEIERLRNGAPDGCEAVRSVRESQTREPNDWAFLNDEIARLRLTEAEHDALEFAVETGRVAMHDEATLRNLLERLTHDAVPEARAAEPESSVPLGSVAAPANTHTLTDAEREAVERAADWLDRWQQTHGYHSSESGDLATLRGLLKRLR